MKDIKFTAVYGDETKEVELSNPLGGGSGYHVYIDRYYTGTIIKRNGKWAGFFNPKSQDEFTSDDIMILGDIIDASPS